MQTATIIPSEDAGAPTPASEPAAGPGRRLVRARIHALRAGTFPAAARDLTVTRQDIARIAAAYDPDRYQAPVVIGHPADDDPAWGWVVAAIARDDGLWLDVELLPEMAELIRAGRYRTVSVALWTPNAPGNPAPGVYSLRHLGFLGAVPPAVKGLAPVRIAAADSARDVITITMSDIETRKEQTMDEPNRTPAPRDGGQTAQLAERIAELERRAAELQHREERLKQVEAELARREADLRREKITAELETHVREGRIAAAEVDHLATIVAVLEAHDGTVRCAEGERRPADMFREWLKRLPARVDLAERAASEKAPTRAPVAVPRDYAVDPDRLALHEAAVGWMTAHPGTDYVTAVRAVEARFKQEA